MAENSEKRITGTGIRLGKILGIEIILDWTWFIIFAVLWWGLGKSLASTLPNEPLFLAYLVGGLTAILFFASVLFHELAHSMVAKHFKIFVRSITLLVFGGIARMGENEERFPFLSPRIEFWVAIAGPVSSFVLAGFFYGIIHIFLFPEILSLLFWHCYYWYWHSPLLLAMLNYLFLLNMVLGIFNLVPAYPMDGGRIFRAFWWWKLKDLVRATKIAYQAGIGAGISLVVFGYFWGGIWTALWIGFIAFLLIRAARHEYQILVKQELSKKIEKVVGELRGNNPKN